MIANGGGPYPRKGLSILNPKQLESDISDSSDNQPASKPAKRYVSNKIRRVKDAYSVASRTACTTTLLLSKRLAIHASFLGLITAIVIQGRAMAGVDHSSLLYTLISGEEVAEGPLDPSAYAQTDAPGVGGARLAVADGGLGVDIITFEDPEVDFAATLGGTAVTAPLSPVTAEPGKDNGPTKVAKKPFVYTVAAGDTIAAIANKFDVGVDTVLWANGLSGADVIREGDHLTILPTDGVMYTVKSGDTVLGIAHKFDIEAKNIKEYNGLEDNKLAIGDKLIIPGAKLDKPSATPVVVPNNVRLADLSGDEPTPEPAKAALKGFNWPTLTKHISQYYKWGHTGVDIDNRSKPPIYAAMDGTVEYAGWLGAYGNLVIINHGNGMQTYYAHLEKFYVSKGTKVAKGSAIAKMGSTGRSTGPHLHFEVRRGGRPINPMGMF